MPGVGVGVAPAPFFSHAYLGSTHRHSRLDAVYGAASEINKRCSIYAYATRLRLGDKTSSIELQRYVMVSEKKPLGPRPRQVVVNCEKTLVRSVIAQPMKPCLMRKQNIDRRESLHRPRGLILPSQKIRRVRFIARTT